MFYEWVLILLLAITVLLIYLVLLFRKLLSKLEPRETLTSQVQQRPAAETAWRLEPPKGEASETDEEIRAVIIAAIAAYEEDKKGELYS